MRHSTENRRLLQNINAPNIPERKIHSGEKLITTIPMTTIPGPTYHDQRMQMQSTNGEHVIGVLGMGAPGLNTHNRRSIRRTNITILRPII